MKLLLRNFILIITSFSFFCDGIELNDVYLNWLRSVEEGENKNLDSSYLYINEAIKLAEETKIEEHFTFLYSERAAINDKLGNYLDAVKDWTKVIELSPYRTAEVFDAYWNRGLAFYSLGDNENLIKDFDYVCSNDQRIPKFKQYQNIIQIDNYDWNNADEYEKEFIINAFLKLKLISKDYVLNVSNNGKCFVISNYLNDEAKSNCFDCKTFITKDDCRCNYFDDQEKERKKKEEEIKKCKDNCTRVGVVAAQICSFLKAYPCKAACATAVAELTRQCSNCCDYDSWYDACLRPLEQFVRYPEDWRDCDNKEEQKQKERGW